MRHSKTNLYCSIICQKDYEYKIRIRQWIEEGKDWTYGIPKWVKKYIAEQNGYTCEECGISDYNNKPIVLECDHIDGNHKNNKVENLRLVCPNCHSQSSNYKNKNYGNGRHYRTERYAEGKSY
jgi:5-methylcytosine-specific restriction endonuclease McrA